MTKEEIALQLTLAAMSNGYIQKAPVSLSDSDECRTAKNKLHTYQIYETFNQICRNLKL